MYKDMKLNITSPLFIKINLVQTASFYNYLKTARLHAEAEGGK